MFKTTAMVHLTNRRQALAALQRAERRGFYTKIAILAACSLGLVSILGTNKSESSSHRQLLDKSRWKIRKPKDVTHEDSEEFSTDSFKGKLYERYLFIHKNTIKWAHEEKTGFWGFGKAKKSIKLSKISEISTRAFKKENKTVFIKGENKCHKFIFEKPKDYDQFLLSIKSYYFQEKADKIENIEFDYIENKTIISAEGTELELEKQKEDGLVFLKMFRANGTVTTVDDSNNDTLIILKGKSSSMTLRFKNFREMDEKMEEYKFEEKLKGIIVSATKKLEAKELQAKKRNN